jgi:hypothetical protein
MNVSRIPGGALLDEEPKLFNTNNGCQPTYSKGDPSAGIHVARRTSRGARVPNARLIQARDGVSITA